MDKLTAKVRQISSTKLWCAFAYIIQLRDIVEFYGKYYCFKKERSLYMCLLTLVFLISLFLTTVTVFLTL